MSTIATPRDASLPRRPNPPSHPSNINTSLPAIPSIQTPNSARPSLDFPLSNRSTSASPSRSTTTPHPTKRNRAALREYYNLHSTTPSDAIDTRSETSSIHDSQATSPTSILDSENFNAEEYVTRVLEEESLTGVLRVYGNIVREISALEGERKGLVYDNYSKLLVATEMIGRMRGEGQGGGGEVGRVVEGVYERVEGLRREVRGGEGKGERDRRAREVVKRVLDTPGKMRVLVKEGEVEEARRVWEPVRGLLEKLRERGVGGEDVNGVLEEGERVLSGKGEV